MYNELRQEWLNSCILPTDFNQLTDNNKFRVLINIDNVKLTAQFIANAYNHRTKILFLNSNRNH